MKLKLFEYVVLLHPVKEDEGKTVILKDKASILAKDEKQVGIMAAREIPKEHLDSLDQVEVIVRPF